MHRMEIKSLIKCSLSHFDMQLCALNFFINSDVSFADGCVRVDILSKYTVHVRIFMLILGKEAEISISISASILYGVC